MSPSAVKMSASKPSSVAYKLSASTTTYKRLRTSTSVSFVNRIIAHLDWIGSINLVESLQARANLVVLENSVMTILSAYCALSVNASASSRIIILCIPAGTLTFW